MPYESVVIPSARSRQSGGGSHPQTYGLSFAVHALAAISGLAECVDGWLEGNEECPTCRRSISAQSSDV